MMTKEEECERSAQPVREIDPGYRILTNLVYSLDLKNHDHGCGIVFVILVVTIVRYALDFSECV